MPVAIGNLFITCCCFQGQFNLAKPLLKKAVEISQQAPFWHCRLLFQLAVSFTFLARLYECTERAIALPQHRRWQRRRHGQNVKVLCSSFYVMGKALSGELSCTWTCLVTFNIKVAKVYGHLHLSIFL